MERNIIKYRIAGFNLTQFVPSWEGTVEGEDFEMNNGIDFSYNHKESVINCTQNVEFSQYGRTVLKIQLCTYVMMEPNSVAPFIEDGKLILPPYFLAQCASFGHGALRGIMYLKTTNTPMEGIIMPPVVYNELFKKPISFDLSEKK